MSKVNYNTTIGEMHDACPFVKHTDIDYDEGEILCNRCDFNSICAMLPEEWEIEFDETEDKNKPQIVINMYGNIFLDNATSNVCYGNEVKENDEKKYGDE